MFSLDDFLRAAHVRLSDLTTANKQTVCPLCSHKRVKKHDKCCDVRLNDNSELVLWNCKHCGENGSFKVNDDAPRRPKSNGSAVYYYGPNLRHFGKPKP